MFRFIEFKPDDPESVEQAEEQRHIMEAQGYFEKIQIPMGVWIVIVMDIAAPIELTPKGLEAAQSIPDASL